MSADPPPVLPHSPLQDKFCFASHDRPHAGVDALCRSRCLRSLLLQDNLHRACNLSSVTCHPEHHQQVLRSVSALDIAPQTTDLDGASALETQKGRSVQQLCIVCDSLRCTHTHIRQHSVHDIVQTERFEEEPCELLKHCLFAHTVTTFLLATAHVKGFITILSSR